MEAKKQAAKKGHPILIPGIPWRPGLVGVLPVFRGYTVDARLREFRKASPKEGLEIIPFASAKGAKLLADYREHGGEA
jgi:hypothetical protein